MKASRTTTKLYQNMVPWLTFFLPQRSTENGTIASGYAMHGQTNAAPPDARFVRLLAIAGCRLDFGATDDVRWPMLYVHDSGTAGVSL